MLPYLPFPNFQAFIFVETQLSISLLNKAQVPAVLPPRVEVPHVPSTLLHFQKPCQTVKPSLSVDFMNRGVRAAYLFTNGFGSYNVLKNNCEDFALHCKTGLLINQTEATGSSGQVDSIISASAAATISRLLTWIMSKRGLLMSNTNPIVTSVGAALYILNRYASDIGVRDDAVKVEIEGVDSLCPSDMKPSQRLLLEKIRKTVRRAPAVILC
ncbi:OLC1v1028877C1 [Oldenlandia corymbosa var. corymbosa]|uniref:OLC1v1028877C1 n=1 Tax=Oldenlandia corymbosa var. corymbosa TaxID=529605 RepID=A0AAV1CD58_OLDCO|nr:OLC1v1028877C1 [Oldenlandia corymbosa var. corymbosa]